MRSLLSFLIIIAFVGIANAESDMPNITPEIESVISGGHWQSAE
jgi:hypothetical protein